MSDTIKILHRYTNAVLYEGASGMTMRETLEAATEARANLAGANLAGANLADANLAGANLADANLAGAYLADANLAGANLADANLAGANLAGAYLAGAYLADAYLAGAKWRDGVVITRVPLQLYGLRWPVSLLDAHIEIGCQFHTIAAWGEFDDAQIAAMDGRNALRFWRENKAAIMALAATREAA